MPVLFAENPVTKQTAVGTAVAIAGCSVYSLLKAKEKEVRAFMNMLLAVPIVPISICCLLLLEHEVRI